MFLNNVQQINKFAEFSDSILETEFDDYENDKNGKTTKRVLLLLATINLVFFIPDYFLMQRKNDSYISLAVRIVFFIIILTVCLFYNKIKNVHTISVIISSCEIIVTVFFIYVYILYREPDFMIQTFGLIVIIVSIFLLPNRWIYKLYISLFITIVFFIISVVYVKGISMNQLSSAIVYTSIIITLMVISSFRNNIYKRTQYALNKKLLDMATKDQLTGLFNRAKFEEEVKKFINLSNRYTSKFSVLLFDIDDFKKINDNYGHMTGDNIIVECTSLVEKEIRDTDIFARWGGEEFIILMPETEINEAKALAQRLLKMIDNNIFMEGIHITCSFGVSQYALGEDYTKFFDKVDKLLYKAKNNGKNMVCVG